MKNNSNIKSLAKMASGAGIAFVLSTVGFGLMFVFKLLAAKYFGPSDFGVFSLLETILGISLVIGSLGLVNGFSRYIPYYTEKGQYSLLKGYVRFVLIISFIFSSFLGSVIFLYAHHITEFFGFPDDFTKYLKILCFVIPFIIVDEILKKYLIAFRKIFHPKFSTDVLRKVIFILGLATIWLFNLDLMYLVIVFLGGHIFPLVYDAFMFRRHMIISPVKALFNSKEWVLFSLPLVFSGVFAFIIKWTDNIVIGKIMSSESLGIYAVVFSLAGVLLFFQKGFSIIFLPLISQYYAKGDSSQISFLFRKSAAWAFGFTVPFVIILVVFGREVLLLLYGSSYVDGHIPLLILAIGFIINVSCGLSSQIIVLHAKTTFFFYINIIVAIFNVGLNIYLIPILGLVGAAISSALSMAVRNLLFLLIAKRYEKLLFDWLYYLKFILAGIPAAYFASLVFRFNLPDFFLAVIALGIYAGLYLLFLLLMRTFTKDDLQIMLMVEKKLRVNLGFAKHIVKKFY